ncbi:MAG TPA: fibrinogen-like YCDxxxxGGGW domain-containing protein, partial [Candidatus Nanopelagicales bacterium]|nr:fibrinogen-like YCDxxxxGGGW domain-containing protein [Candidatus Nanopelagicales bacterium]
MDDDCNGTANDSCAYAGCNDLPRGSPSGVYTLDLDGAGPDAPFGAYCDMETSGGGWALLFNSVGSPEGATTAFWNIPYADRFGVKGAPGLDSNFYGGSMYLYGLEYRDEIE